MFAVTKMIRFFLMLSFALDWKRRPSSGMSPRIGTLSLIVCRSSRIRPPSTTVEPSWIRTLVLMRRVLKTGWLMSLGESSEVEPSGLPMLICEP